MEKRRGLGLREGGIVVMAFVDLMVGSVLSAFGDVFFFFLLVMFASEILAGDWDNASWSCHKALMSTTTILVHLIQDSTFFFRRCFP